MKTAPPINLHRLLPSLALALLSLTAPAQLRLPSIFSDGAVLQRDIPVCIWGWAAPGETVTVRFADQSPQARADDNGRWLLHLKPLTTSEQPRALIVESQKPDQTLRVKDILVGEVFLCSGQSNMAMSMDSCTRRAGTPDDIRDTRLPQVRFFQAPNATFSATPRDDVEAKWERVDPASNAHFSAVAFYFARALHQELKLPIGIVRASHGGGAAEIKMPVEALKSTEAGRRSYEDALKRYTPEARAARDKLFLQRWETARDEAEKNHLPVPPRPQPSPEVDGGYPSSDWNGVIAPIIRYTRRAVLWYQGEHNAGRAFEYRDTLKVLIKSWRQASGQDDLLFVIVQLPAYNHPEAQKNWPILRESQWFAQRETPHTALVVTIDLGEPDNIHPADKREVGERLALETRRLAFNDTVSGCGPLYERCEVEGARIRITFSNTTGHLRASGDKPLTGFVVAGADHKFIPASARIEGQTVIVESREVPKPLAVRYGWEGFPHPNLTSSQGLPAGPFRTDQWKD